nr:hypothetical protein [Tanacetum cinerariifolium]
MYTSYEGCKTSMLQLTASSTSAKHGRIKQINKTVDIPSSSAAKKGYPQIPTFSSNILTSNPYDLLSQKFDPKNYKKSRDDPESEEEVEVLFDESVNLLNSKNEGYLHGS